MKFPSPHEISILRHKTLISNLIIIALITSTLCTAACKPSSNHSKKPTETKALITDYYGDPLPHGAVVRLGTTRLRQPGGGGEMAFSPDGSMLAAWGQGTVVQVSETATGKTILTTSGHADRIQDVYLDAKRIITVETQTTHVRVTEWNLSSHQSKVLASFNEKSNIIDAEISPGGDKLAVISADGLISIRDIQAKASNIQFAMPPAISATLAFSHKSHYLAVGLSAKQTDTSRSIISLWNLASKQEMRLVDQETRVANINKIAFSPNDEMLATVDYIDSLVEIWDLNQGTRTRVPLNNDRIRSVDFSPDMTSLACAGESGGIHIYNLGLGIIEKTLSAGFNITAISYSPDGNTTAVTSQAAGLRLTTLWDIASGKQRIEFPAHSQRVTYLYATVDGKRYITSSIDQTIRIWSSETGQQLNQIGTGVYGDLHGEGPPFTVSPDGNTLATVMGASLKLYDIVTCKLIRETHIPAFSIVSIQYSPDGKTITLLSISQVPRTDSIDLQASRNEVLIYQIENNKFEKVINTLDNFTNQISYTPDGKGLIVISHHTGFEISLYDTDSWAKINSSQIDNGRLLSMSSVEISPDRSLFAAYTGASEVSIWTISSESIKKTLVINLPTQQYLSLTFSEDHEMLVVVGKEKTILYNAITGNQILEYASSPALMIPIALTGNKLLISKPDGNVLVYDVRQIQKH